MKHQVPLGIQYTMFDSLSAARNKPTVTDLHQQQRQQQSQQLIERNQQMM